MIEDMGKGTIFDNILKINEEMTERLKLHVDLTQQNAKRMNRLGEHPFQNAKTDIIQEELQKGMTEKEIKKYVKWM